MKVNHFIVFYTVEFNDLYVQVTSDNILGQLIPTDITYNYIHISILIEMYGSPRTTFQV